MLEPGQIFANRYRVERRIAEGGMGAIFEAEHTGTERRVALKLLFPHIMSVASARQKFELEAKVSARVNSPYIVGVLDAGFDEATRSPYLVMELLNGQTLAAYVREHDHLGADEAVRLLQQVAAGLDAAHGYREPGGAYKPIVHRDLKPENLFITREHDGTPLVKILDFGIAKVLGETGNVSQEVRGTPLYMAFEQVTAGPLSPATDVWALGLIAYFILTGRRYWRSADQQGSAVQALFAEILTLPIEKPSVRLEQQRVGIALPAAFDAWLLRCLERDPARRFRAAGVAVEELARVFERAPRAGSRSAPRLAPLSGASVTQTFHPLPRAREPQPSTAASLPAVVKERNGLPLRASQVRSRGLLAIVGIAGLGLVGVLAWLLARDTPSVPVAREANQAIEAVAPATISTSVPAPQRPENPSPRVQIALPSPADESPAPAEAVRTGDTRPGAPAGSETSSIKAVKVEDGKGVPGLDPIAQKGGPVRSVSPQSVSPQSVSPQSVSAQSASAQRVAAQNPPGPAAPVRTEPGVVPAEKPRLSPVSQAEPVAPKPKPSAYDVR